MGDKLTLKQKMFVGYYLANGNNGKQAYISAYDVTNPKTAEVNAAKLLSKAKVQNLIAEQTKPTFEKLEINKERVLNEMARVAFFDPKKMFDEDGNLKNIQDMDSDTAAAISSIDVSRYTSKDGKGTETIKRVRLVDKKGSLEMLAKHLDLLSGDSQTNIYNQQNLIIDDDLLKKVTQFTLAELKKDGGNLLEKKKQVLEKWENGGYE